MALLGTLVPFWNAYEERGAGLNATPDEHVCSGVARFLFIESSRAPGRKALISVGTTGGADHRHTSAWLILKEINSRIALQHSNCLLKICMTRDDTDKGMRCSQPNVINCK